MADMPPAIATLLQSAAAALQRGDPPAALHLLGQAETLAPGLPEIHFNTALALRMANNPAAAITAIDRVLATQPEHFVALMTKAALVETVAGPRHAARIYREALRAMPPEAQLPPPLRAATQQARRLIEQDAAELRTHLQAATQPLRPATEDAAQDRFDQSLDGFAGAAPVAVQRPLMLRYSQMPAIPFYDRALFAWLPTLEAATDIITAELQGALAQAAGDFVPYIQFPANAPVGQWADLNHSTKWNSYFLWKDGTRHTEACARCPRTTALVESLPLMHQPGFAPTVVFSALQPHTHIPPHTGSANTRLLCHLPLIVPGPARFRVGPVTRTVRKGQAWVFDDTIEHEAWNDAGELRVILIIDLWSPLLTDTEKTLIAAMMTARNAYYQG